MGKPHLILIGGFLGAGKTTAIQRIAHCLGDQGLRVGIITNDQSTGLVDTAFLRSCGFTTEEVPGGCFCCRFDDLMHATRRLTSTLQPDVFVAEAVGSCTDLAATVALPFRRLYGDRITIAPLTVLVDPMRARRVLGLDSGDSFSDNIAYIYRKQLEEADIILINKRDLLSEVQSTELQDVLRASFPHAELHTVSCRDGVDTEEWLHRIAFGELVPRPAMGVDYDTYADGEARLGWLNATIAVSLRPPADGNALTMRLAALVRERLQADGAQLAHLKMMLESIEPSGAGTAAINLVRNDLEAESRTTLATSVGAGRLLVNLRAEAVPQKLVDALRGALTALTGERPRLRVEIEQLDCFSPGRPTPTHRDTGATL